MKKLLAFLLCLTMALGLLAGCQPDTPPETTGGTSASTGGTSTPTGTAAPTQEPQTGVEGKIVLLYTSNIRGNLALYAQVAAAKAKLEGEGATVYLVDAGNYLQGGAGANSDRGLAVYNLMDAAGYDVAAMGPLEFVYGPATTGLPYHSNLTKYFTQAELYRGAEELEYRKNAPSAEEAVLDTRPAKAPVSFQVICTNLLQVADYGYYAYEPNAVLGDSFKLGFVCVVGPELRDKVQDGFLDGYTLTDVVETPDCDLLVSLGSEMTGDIHILPDPNGEPVIGAYLIDPETGAFSVLGLDLFGEDEAVAALAQAAMEAASPVVGTALFDLNGKDSASRNGETNLGDLTADALKWYAENKLEGFAGDVPVVAIQNGGNCDQFLYAGDITETDLLWALPFSPMGVGVLYVTGAELLETLEAATQTADCPGWAQVAGLTYQVDTAQPYDAGEEYGDFFKAASIHRVTITSVGGEPFDENATYALVADNFLMNGNDTYYTLSEIKNAHPELYLNNGNGVKTRDIVAMYIREVLGGTVGEPYAAPQGRITVQ